MGSSNPKHWFAPQTKVGDDLLAAAEEEQQKRLLASRPGAAPDLTDDVIRAAAEAEAKRIGLGRTRKNSFLGGL